MIQDGSYYFSEGSSPGSFWYVTWPTRGQITRNKNVGISVRKVGTIFFLVTVRPATGYFFPVAAFFRVLLGAPRSLFSCHDRKVPKKPFNNTFLIEETVYLFFGIFLCFPLGVHCEKSQSKIAKYVKKGQNLSTQKNPGLMTYAYEKINFSKSSLKSL